MFTNQSANDQTCRLNTIKNINVEATSSTGLVKLANTQSAMSKANYYLTDEQMYLYYFLAENNATQPITLIFTS